MSSKYETKLGLFLSFLPCGEQPDVSAETIPRMVRAEKTKPLALIDNDFIKHKLLSLGVRHCY